MKNFRPAVFAAIAGSLSACVHISHLSSLSKGTQGQVDAAKAAEALEAKQPQEAAKRYQAVLASVIVYKRQSDYQKELSTELSQASGNDTADFSSDSPLALPHNYDAAVEAQARAQLGMARLALAKSDAGEAEAWAGKAVALVNKRALSPVTAARLNALAYGVLRQVYAKQGKAGREQLAALDQGLAEDYLASEAAQAAQAQDQQAADADRQTVAKIDGVVDQINSGRTKRFMDNLAQAMGSVAGAMSTMQSYQINNAYARSGGRMTPQIQQMQAVQRTFNFQLQVLSAMNPAFRQGMANSSMLLSPFASVTMTQQLVNPMFGMKAPSLIKLFAGKIADMSGNDSLKEAAKLVDGSVDTVVAARQASHGELGKALEGFAKSFGALQNQADGITVAVSKP